MANEARLNVPAVAVAGIAFLILVISLFVTWAEQSVNGDFGFQGGPTIPVDAETDFTFWGADSGQDSVRYYDSDLDEVDGIGMIRAALPIYLVGGVMLLDGFVLLVLDGLGKTRLGTVTRLITLAAAILMVLGVLLFQLGLSEFLDDAAANNAAAGLTSDSSLFVGFWMGWIAAAAGIGAAVLAFIGGKTQVVDGIPAP